MKKAVTTLLMLTTFLYFASANKQSMETNIGQKFGRLTISKTFLSRTNAGHSRMRANCVCDCGNTTEVWVSSLTTSNTRSCGCLNLERIRKHNLSNHPLRFTRLGFIRRCYKPNSKSYHNYGGRGIKVCQEWLDDYMNFYNWAVSNGWRKGLTLDREDNNGDYSPDNCRWVTYAVQESNKRVTRNITIDGITKSIYSWARFYGVGPNTLVYRMKKNPKNTALSFYNKNTSQ
jgi:hypothetical protein